MSSAIPCLDVPKDFLQDSSFSLEIKRSVTDDLLTIIFTQ